MRRHAVLRRTLRVTIAATAAVACAAAAWRPWEGASPSWAPSPAWAGPGPVEGGSDVGGAAGGVGVGAVVTLLARDAIHAVRWVEVPAITARLGAVVLGELDVVRGGPPPPALLGDPPPALTDDGAWPLALAGAVSGRGPFGAGDDCPCGTRLGDLATGRRVALLQTLATFTVPADAADLRVLEVRARYRDGLALWLNGVPVARRNLATAGHPLRLAERLRGPEWETFFVPVTPGLLRAGDNVLAAAVHPSGAQRAPLLELEVVARRQSHVVRGPLVQRVGATSATIVVETDLPAGAELAWGPGPGSTPAPTQRLAATSDAGGRRHLFELRELPEAAPVHYQVTVDGVAGPVHTFSTPPRAGEVLRVAIYGDVRGGHATHARVIAALAREAPDLVLATGDLVARGTDEGDWQRFFQVAAPLLATTPFYSCIGNHDLGQAGDLRRRFVDIFALPPPPPDRPAGAGWYSFAVAGVHVVVLDSNRYDDAAQLRWLEADLAAARAAGVRAILALTHDGPFSRGLHGGNQRAARDYAPVLARAGVTLLFSGHEHLYQRGRHAGLDYLVSGGGGAPLYAISCGVPGKPRCKVDDGMLHVAREHHYVLMTLYPRHAEVCPRLLDGTPLEPCITYQLPR